MEIYLIEGFDPADWFGSHKCRSKKKQSLIKNGLGILTLLMKEVLAKMDMDFLDIHSNDQKVTQIIASSSITTIDDVITDESLPAQWTRLVKVAG